MTSFHIIRSIKLWSLLNWSIWFAILSEESKHWLENPSFRFIVAFWLAPASRYFYRLQPSWINLNAEWEQVSIRHVAHKSIQITFNLQSKLYRDFISMLVKANNERNENAKLAPQLIRISATIMGSTTTVRKR